MQIGTFPIFNYFLLSSAVTQTFLCSRVTARQKESCTVTAIPCSRSALLAQFGMRY